MTETFSIAVVGSAYGLKGFVKVRSLSGETSHLEELKSVKLRKEEVEKVFSIEEILPSGANKENGNFLLVKFQGIDNPEAAAALKGAALIAGRPHAAPLKMGEYYVEDLKGLRVIAQDFQGKENPPSDAVSPSEEVLGHIMDILEGGNGELAEIRLLSGEIKLVPFRKEFFSDISVEKGRALLLERWILE